MEALVFITDEITPYAGQYGIIGSSMMTVRDQLKAYDEYDSIRAIINSPGGRVTEGEAIHGYLLSQKVPLVNEVIGVAASSATIPLMAAQVRKIAAMSEILVHPPSNGEYGTADDLESMAKNLRKTEERMSKFYARTTGKKQEDILALMKEDRPLTAEEALDWGFVTEILDDAQAFAGFNLWTEYVDARAKGAVLMMGKKYHLLNPERTKTPQSTGGKNPVEQPKTDNDMSKKTIEVSAARKLWNELFGNGSTTAQMTRTAQDGTVITFETDKEVLEEGVQATIKGEPLADGEYTMKDDGLKVIMKGGKISKLEVATAPPASTESQAISSLLTEMKQVKDENAELKKTVQSTLETVNKAVQSMASFQVNVGKVIGAMVSPSPEELDDDNTNADTSGKIDEKDPLGSAKLRMKDKKKTAAEATKK